MRHTPCGCCPPDNTAEYSDYLAGPSQFASASRFDDLKYATAQTKLLGKSKKGVATPFLVVLRGIAKAGLPREPSEAVRAGKGGTTKRTRPAACGGARDMKLARTNARGATVAVAQETRHCGAIAEAPYACGVTRRTGASAPTRRYRALRARRRRHPSGVTNASPFGDAFLLTFLPENAKLFL